MNPDKHILKRNEKAKQLLLGNEIDRVPFILYLRVFQFNAKHGKNNSQPRQFLEEHIYQQLPEGVNLITTAWKSDDNFRKGASEKIPSIILGEDWQPFAKAIISRAEMIIMELPHLSKGVIWELDTIIKENKNHNTVLVLPPIDTIVSTIDHQVPLDQFPRVVWADQLFKENILENFVCKDLIKRLIKISEADKRKRMIAYESATNLNSSFPITYEGVLEGYLERINIWDTYINFSEADLSYYKFWDYFRISSIAWIDMKIGKNYDKDYLYQEILNAYLNIVQCVLIRPEYLKFKNSFLSEGVYFKIVESINPLLDKIKNPDWFLVSLAEKTINRVNETYK